MEKPLTKWMGFKFVAVLLSLALSMSTSWAQQLQSFNSPKNNTNGNNSQLGGSSIMNQDNLPEYKEGAFIFKIANALDKHFDNTIISKDVNGNILTGLAKIDALNATYRVSGIKRVFRHGGKWEAKHRKAGLHRWYQLVIPNNEDAKQVSEAYMKLSEIEDAYPVFNTKLYGMNGSSTSTIDGDPDDPMFSQQWGYKNTGQTGGTAGADINAVAAWAVETGDADVIVSIHDMGIDFDHEDLAGNMWVNPGETAGNNIDDDNNGYVDDVYGYNFVEQQGTITPGFHGAHVAGTVAAETNNGVGVSGVAGGSGSDDGIRMMSAQVYTPGGAGGGHAEAIIYEADNGSVISQNSWGYTSPGVFPSDVQAAIDYFIEFAGTDENGDPIPGHPMIGGIYINAAGNDGLDDEWYPGFYEPAVAVGSMTHDFSKSSFSNWGDWVDIAAPGSSILSTYHENDYNTISGTSMACPHVSGVAALIISKFKGNINPEQVRSRIISTATDISVHTGSTPIGPLVNAFAALAEDDGVPPNAITDLGTANEGPVNIDLTWTAPADLDGDGLNPIPAAGYDIRYSTSPIGDDTDFDNATQVNGEPSPKAPGESETYTVWGLQPSTMYYFAVKSFETFGGFSDLSNIASATTTAAPEITVSVADLTETHDGAGPFNSTFTIGNTGGLELNYEVSAQVFDGFNGGMSYAAETDVPTSNVGIGGGGVYATRYVVPEGGTFEVTHLVNHIQTSGASEITIDIVGGGSTPADGTNLTSQTYTRDSGVASEWQFFSLDNPQTFNANDEFWVVFTFPVNIGFPQGYDDIGEYIPGITYVSFDGGTTYDELSGFAGWENRVFKMAALNGSNWVTLNPASGTIPASTPDGGNGPGDITVTFDRSQLLDGTYNAGITITSDDPFSPVVMIPVELTVTGGVPVAVINSDPVDFGLVASGAEVWHDLMVMNTGLGDLTVDASLSGDPEFTTDADGQITIAPGQGDVIRITYAAGDVGTKSSTLTLATNDPNAASVQISLSGESVPPPVIVAGPESFTFDLVSTQVESQTLNIANNGTGAALEYDIFVSDQDPGVLRNIFRKTIPKVKAKNNIDYSTPAYIEKLAKSDLNPSVKTQTSRDGHLDGKDIVWAEDFDSGNGIPDSWTIIDNIGGGVQWGLNSEVSGQGNTTNGSGESATVDSDAAGSGSGDVDTELITPLISTDGFSDFVIEYETDFRVLSDNFDLDISTDGGNSWTNILAWDTDHRQEHVSVDLNSYLEGAEGFHLRWKYYNGNWSWWVQVDNVVLYGMRQLVEVTPNLGSVAAGENSDLTVTADAATAAEGQYLLNVNIINNDPQNSVVVIPVTVNITAIPVIAVGESVDFGDVYVGQDGQAMLKVANNGPADLVIMNMESDNADFNFHTMDYVGYGSGANQVPDPVETNAEGGILAHIEVGESAAVLVVYGDFENLSSGYDGSHIHIGGAGETGEVLFSLNPTLSGDGLSGEYRPDDNIFVLNEDIMGMLTSGGLYWNLHTVDNAAGELRGQLYPGTVIDSGEEKDLHLSFSPSAAGEITGNLTLSHNDPLNGNSSVIALTGNGVDAPVAVITPASLDFTAAFGDEVVANQSFNIDNSTGGSVLEYANEINYSFDQTNNSINNELNSSGDDEVKIVGGEDIDISDAPWQIELRLNGGHWCGGSILNEEWIITAAHCLDDGGLSNYDVRLGFTSLSSGEGAVHEIEEIITHPDWTGSASGGGDIALLRMATPIDLSDPTKARTIRYATQDDADAGLTDAEIVSFITGWGALSQGGGGPDILQGVYVPIVTNEYANIAYGGSVLDDMLAAGLPEGGMDACQGDSGGPLVVPDYGGNGALLAGLTSWGNGCALPDFPGIYTRVSWYEEWIFNHTGLASVPAGPSDWLTLSMDEGTVDAGSSQGIDAMIDLTDLEAGEYHAMVKVHTNDPVNPMADVMVNLTITGTPNLIIEPGSIDFSDTTWAGTYAMTELMLINGTDENPATAPLHVTEVSAGGAFDIMGEMEDDGIWIPRGDTVWVPVKFHPEAAGDYTGTLTVVSNDPTNSIAEVQIVGTAVQGPVVSADQQDMTFTLQVGANSTQNLVLSNAGGADSEFAVLVASGLPDPNTLRALDNILYQRIPAVEAKPIDEARINDPAYQAKLANSDQGSATQSSANSVMRNGDKVVVMAEDFDSGNGIPETWTIVDNIGGGVQWGLNSVVSGQGNLTGGSGESATCDSDAAGSSSGDVDTELITPAISTDGFENFVIEYKVDFRVLSDNFDLDISTDGGANWTNVIAWDSDHREEFVSMNIDQYIAGADEFHLRWRYYNGNWSWWAQIDDVVVLADNAILSVTPTEGTIAVSEGQTLDVTATAANITAGTYQSGLAVFSQDPFNSAFYVPVTIDVEGGAPVLVVTSETQPEDSVKFGSNIVGMEPMVKSFHVANEGDGFLIINGLVDNADFSIHTPDYLALATGENQPEAVTTDATGWLSAHVEEGEDDNPPTVRFWGSFETLGSAYTASHVHIGAPGESGDVLYALTAMVSGDELSGEYKPEDNTFELTEDAWNNLRSGNLYLNVHSTDNAGGEIRGQFYPGGILPPGEDWEVDVAFNPSATGDIEGTLTLANNDENNSAATVILTGTGVDSPVTIGVNPTEFNEEVMLGTSSTATMTISNSGTEDLHFSIDVEGVDMGEGEGERMSTRFKSNNKFPYQTNMVGTSTHTADADASKAIGLDVRTTASATQRDGHIKMLKDFEGYALGDLNGQDGWFTNSPIWTVSDENPGNGAQHLKAISNSGFGFALTNDVPSGDSEHSSGSAWVNIGSPGELYEVIPQDPTAGSVITRLRFEPNGTLSILDFDANDYIIIPESSYPVGEYMHIGFTVERATNYLEVFLNGELIYTGTSFGTNIENFAVLANGLSSGDAMEVDDITIIDGLLEFGPGSFVYPDVDGGTIPGGESMDIELTFDATELVNGVYHANIIIENNDPFNPVVEVPATMTVVGGEAEITLDVTSLEFGEHLIGDEAHWPFTVTNTGTADLEVTDVTITGDDFSVDVTSGILHPGETGVVVVTFEPSVPETIAEVLKVHSNAGNPTVILSGTGILPPAIIAVSPDHLEKELLNDETASDNFTIANSGEGELEYFALAVPARMGEGGNGSGMRNTEVNTSGYTERIKSVKSSLSGSSNATQRDGHEVDVLEELGYDPEGAPSAFIGAGGDAHSLATRFWSEEGFILTHVRNFYRTEDQFVENIGLRIYVGEDINDAQMLTHQMVTDKSIEGEFMLIELDNPQAFGPGETFWVVYDYPEGIQAPQGYHLGVPNVNGLYYVNLGGGFAPVEDFIPEAAFKSRAIMDGNFDGGSSVGWIELSANNGTVGPNSSADVTVTFDASGVRPGHHAADILIFSNDPVNDVEGVRVDLHIGNRAPMAIAQIDNQEMDINDAFSVDLSTIFSDPDGDDLHVWSATDNAMVAETDVEDGILWVWAKASGEADITVRAEDPSGALAQVDFVVTVAPVAGNTAPTLEAEFADITVEYDGESAFIDVSPNFADADGDELNYWATASNANVSIDGLEGNSILEVEPNVVGTADVTVWASDGKGGEISDTFTVTVEFTGENNAPVVLNPLMDQTIELDHTWSHNLEGVFHDEDGDDLHHWSTSEDESIAHGWVDENGLHVSGNKVGSTNVSVWAADGKGGEVSTTFAVTVEFTDENADPHVTMEIADQDLEIGGSSYTIDLRTVFGDADGDNLDFWASSDNVDKATAMVEGTVLVVEPQQGGIANITVWATDNKGGTDAMDDFMVTIVDNSNTAPTIAAAIDDKIILPGANTDVVDLSAVFTDVEGDALTYTATTDDASIADIAIDGSNLTVTSGVVGMVNIKVWADDGNSPAVMDEYMVTVNTSPETSGLGDQTILMGGSNLSIDVSGSFSDADGDNLTYSATSSDGTKATVSVEGSTVMVNQVDAGSSTIAVTATDPQNGSVSADFLVTLEANDDPSVASAIGAQTLRLEQDPFTVDLSTVFGDANSDPLTYTASSNNEGVATVSIADGMLTVTQVAAGNAFISVWADDERGGTRAEDGFGVEVTENQKPTATGTIADSNQEFGVDLTSIFTDADGDAMTFNASSSDEAIAAVAISGNNMVVAHIAVGSATITVTATDSNGATSDPLTFEATVSITTGLEDEILSESLTAYPNPAFDIATIKYELKEASEVSLAVYDLNGKMVQLLVNEKQAAGIHTSKLDVSKLSSGVYLYRIIANGKSFTKKLTIR